MYPKLPQKELKPMEQQVLQDINEKLKLMEEINDKLSIIAQFDMRITTVENDVIVMQDDVKILKEENKQLKQELCAANNYIMDLQQYGRLDNIEIVGIPKSNTDTAPENTRQIVIWTMAAVGVTVDPGDIIVAHRVPTRGNHHPNIVCKLRDRNVKSTYVKAFRAKVKICKNNGPQVKDINPCYARYQNERFYVNDHLTPNNKLLLKEAKTRAKAKGYRFGAWFSDGVILVKKEDGTRPIRITSRDDLGKIV